MAEDALDPGPNGDYPHWPRNSDGTEDRRRMPRGSYPQRTRDGRVVVTDQTPRHPVDDPLGRAGLPIHPPIRPPD